MRIEPSPRKLPRRWRVETRGLAIQSGYFELVTDAGPSVFDTESINVRIVGYDENLAEGDDGFGEMYPIGNDLLA